ncbi:MAG: D-aminoacylase [Clostridia bacterium]|nr:D-aminoacylase [Clostridia bacterium]
MKSIGRRAFLVGTASLSLLGLLQPEIVAGWLAGEKNVPSAGKEAEEGAALPEPESVPPVSCDYLLVNGTIIDGSGAPSFAGNLAIKGETIVAIGDFPAAPGAKVIDVAGLVIAPGFIDLHTHTEDYILNNGAGEMILLQGVTSQIGGNCGTSVDSIGSYFAELKEPGVNFGLLVGYKVLRKKCGVDEKGLTAKTLAAMEEELARGLQEGAFGLSVGLEYWPQSKATTDELIALCRVVKDHGGFYAVHIRNEGDRVLPSLEEAIEIGLATGVPVEYSHVKTSGKRNWGKMEKVLELLDQARESGLDMTGDVYGYTFSSLDLDSGRNSIGEEDLQLALKHPFLMIGSDSGLSNSGRAIHPRAYGNYPRILGRYVREQGVLSWEEAIRKMTSLPAKRLGLDERGLLAPGRKADVVAFRPEKVRDQASREDPNIFSVGMEYVFVNGQPAVAEGEPTGIRAGQPLVRG